MGEASASSEELKTMYSGQSSCPWWFHGLGRKMELFMKNKHRIVISGSKAKVVIVKADTVHERTAGWFVNWEIVEAYPCGILVSGRKLFDDEELAAAFGLVSSSGKFGQSLINRYLADSAEKGKYIRMGSFLNIPCPGTGSNGDPNISVYITEEMQNAVRALLG